MSTHEELAKVLATMGPLRKDSQAKKERLQEELKEGETKEAGDFVFALKPRQRMPPLNAKFLAKFIPKYNKKHGTEIPEDLAESIEEARKKAKKRAEPELRLQVTRKRART